MYLVTQLINRKKSLLTITVSCTCKNLINGYGEGNCLANSAKFGPESGKKYCYVHNPSNCTDLLESDVLHGEKISAVACNSGE